MAIESNRITATTVHKDGTKGTPPPVCGKIVPVAPPEPYFNPVDLSGVSQPAEYEGQIRFVEDASGEYYTAYVVVRLQVDIPPSVPRLVWKPCIFASGTLDPRTGKSYDPLASFYNVLAN